MMRSLYRVCTAAWATPEKDSRPVPTLHYALYRNSPRYRQRLSTKFLVKVGGDPSRILLLLHLLKTVTRASVSSTFTALSRGS